jgi:hypothetical protein
MQITDRPTNYLNPPRARRLLVADIYQPPKSKTNNPDGCKTFYEKILR